MEISINVALTLVGLAMLCFGGNWLVSGGVIITKKRFTKGEITKEEYEDMKSVLE